MPAIVCFDLEGPLSPEDCAYNLMKLIPVGGPLFEAISRYDDLLTLEGREGYEPGDTLALIFPFLRHHGLGEKEVISLAEQATLIPGAAELIQEIREQNSEAFCVTTTYQPYAQRLAQRVGIPPEKVAATPFPQEAKALEPGEAKLVEAAEKELPQIYPKQGDATLKDRLDRFFWKELQNTNLGRLFSQVKPVGGQRKVAAVQQFARVAGAPPRRIAVVGDSITDYKMFQAIRQQGGLAVAFNANEYALPYATIGLASSNIADLMPVLDGWLRNGLTEVERLVTHLERMSTPGDRSNFQWLVSKKDFTASLAVHKQIRALVRASAAKLG